MPDYNTSTGVNKISCACACKGNCNCGQQEKETTISGTANVVTCPVVCSDIVIPEGATKLYIKNIGFKTIQFTEGDDPKRKDLPPDCPIDHKDKQLPEYRIYTNKQDSDPENSIRYYLSACYPPGPGGKEKADALKASAHEN